MTVLFEIVRWILIAGFLLLDWRMSRMVVEAFGDQDSNAPWRAGGAVAVLITSSILAVVTFNV